MSVEKTLSELVAINSVSSRSNAEIISYLAARCEAAGLTIQRFSHIDDSGVEKFNLVAQTLPGAPQAGSVELALVGHTDTVPFDPAWTDALHLTEKDEKLFGRGACDTKAFIAAALTAIENVDLESLRKPLALVFTSDEEIGCLGAKRLAQAMPFTAQYAIVGEPTSLQPMRAGKGYCLAEITVRGREGHSAYPQLGASAIFRAARLIARIEQIAPVLAGEYFLIIPLAANPASEIDIAADNRADLEISTELTTTLKRVVTEAVSLFGATHYTNYHFLLTLSDHTAHFGLEHHESNDSRVAERSLLDDALRDVSLPVIPHEFVHSWNGKYRRPAGLATQNYQEPMKGELLWVYEGLTQYLGNLLCARSGLWTAAQYRDHLAESAADLDHRPGRLWRPLIDTTIAAQVLYGAPGEWGSVRRGVDFYDEGWLIWLDTDTKIRELTGGARSLDDFCKRFHGAPSTSPMVKTYVFDDVVATLNEVAPFDWRDFLLTRLNSTDFHAPLGGIERGGWRLTYQRTPNGVLKDQEQVRRGTEMGYSIGLRLNEDGSIADVIEGMAAAKAGIGPGMKIIAVNGKAYSAEVLRDSVRATTDPKQRRIELLIDNEGHVATHQVIYGEGEKYPVLERDQTKADLLLKIITPLTWSR